MKSNLIITSSDNKYEDFLTNHWLRSLKENVDLKNIDVLVLDYGLSKLRVQQLKDENVQVYKCEKTGHVVTLRFLDAYKYLKKSNYDQILFIDGADIIFQGDISDLFSKYKDSFRVVKLDMEVMFFEAYIPRFPNPLRQKLWHVLDNKPVLNAGFILAPREKFLSLCQQIESLITHKHAYGPDQIILNYILYQNRVKLLPKKYNFIFGTEREGFVIKNGVFYRRNGEKIIVAHNAGHDRFLRPIRNFGYGKNHNQLKYGIYYGRKIIFMFFRLIRILKILWKSYSK